MGQHAVKADCNAERGDSVQPQHDCDIAPVDQPLPKQHNRGDGCKQGDEYGEKDEGAFDCWLQMAAQRGEASLHRVRIPFSVLRAKEIAARNSVAYLSIAGWGCVQITD